MSKLRKSPIERLDYLIDWGRVLSADTDTIASVTWVVPAGLVKTSQSNTTTTTTVWLEGGGVDIIYEVDCRILTVGGRTHERALSIAVQDPAIIY